MALRRARRARRLSLTSLIDVIFLLLLFFMLTSTFSRFSDVDLATAGSGATGTEAQRELLFLRLGEADLSLNGASVAIENLAEALTARLDGPTLLLVSLGPGVTAQRLTDTLVGARGLPDLTVTVLEGS